MIIYGSRRMTDKLQEFHLSLLGKHLIPVPTVKDLRVTFDKLIFNDHIAKTVSSCCWKLLPVAQTIIESAQQLIFNNIFLLPFAKNLSQNHKNSHSH